MQLKLKDGKISSSEKLPIKFIWKWLWGKWGDKRQPLRWHASLDRVVAQVITRMKAMRRKQREMLVNINPQRLFSVYIYIEFHVLNGWQPAPRFSGSPFIIALDEGERILILPWAQAGCQIDLRDFRPGDRLAASTSCATVSDMVTKLCFALVSTSRALLTSNSVSFSTSNCVQQTTKSSTDRDSTIMH